MKPLRRGWRRLLGAFACGHSENELAAEVACHIQMQEDDNVRAGMAPADARRAARLKFGGVEAVKESCRDQRGLPLVEALFRDLRYALRSLRKSPGFTVVVILTLALGIGANTAIFTVVKSVLLAPLPYPDADRLVVVWEKDRDLVKNTPAPANFTDWRVQNQVFEGLGAFVQGIRGDAALTGAGEPEQIHGAQVSANLFGVLRIRPALGRNFLSSDDQTGARVAIIADSLWRRRFGASREVVNRSIALDGTGYTIVGVMPPSFAFPNKQTELWTPLPMNTPLLSSRGAHFLQVFGRLKTGVTVERAAVEMTTIAQRLELQYPETNTAVGTVVVPLRDELVGDVRPILLLLLAAVGLVLLMVCANIANLLLARSLARQRELALRDALGASRGALVRQLLTESVVLWLGGGVAGLLVGFGALEGFFRLVPRDIGLGSFGRTPLQLVGSVDGGVAVYAFGISILTGVLFGLVPALSSDCMDVNEILKAGSRNMSGGGRPARLRSVLVIAETALAFALLIGAGLTLRSFSALTHVQPGFDASHVLTMSLNLPQSRYPTNAERSTAIREIVRRVSEVPGVETAAIINMLPMTFHGGSSSLYVEGTPVPALGQAPWANNRVVSPAYFSAMRIPLHQGRYLNDHDVANAPLVAVINDSMARRYFPGGEALGKRFKLGRPEANLPWFTVAGITGDVHQYGLDTEPNPEMYFHYEQGSFIPPRDLVVRTASDPLGLVRAVQLAIRNVDPGAPTFRVRSMTDVVNESVALPRLEVLVLGGFGFLAVALASVGIYGVMSYAVSQRTAEIGIRMALGARSTDVLWAILKGAVGLILAGLAIGLPVVLLAAGAVSPLLYHVKANDVTTLLTAAALLTLVAIVAALLPAWRASRVNPVVALRNE